MASGVRVGVLSPFVGGDYYGAIIAGINQAAAADGGRVIAFQTLDPGAKGADHCGVPELHLHLGWGHFDAAIVLPGAADARYVRAIQGSGRPVVLVSHALPDVTCPVVTADNRTGVRAAVSHLVDHGHRRIAFAGLIAVSDVRERYEGYVEGLGEHGLEPVPELLFQAPDNHETGGAVVATALLNATGPAAPFPATAIVMGTDRNAIGLMERLQEAGHRLPEELAVVGFDDIPDARYARPSLASIAQPVDRLGVMAYERLRAAVTQGRGTDRGLSYVTTTFVPRDSCGCPPSPLRLSDAQARSQFAENALLQATLNTQYELGIELLRTHGRDPRELAWLGRTPAEAGCLGLWPEEQAEGPDDEDPAPVHRLRDHADPDSQIEVVGAFHATGGPTAPVGRLLPVSSFPPAVLFEAADAAASRVVFVVPVRSDARDWGVLAAVGRIQASTPPGREMMNHSGSLLAVALDHDVVLRTLHRQKERLRRAALFDQLTGLPNRSLLMDRLRRARHRLQRRPERRFALLFLDLDGFKAVNDSLGHAAGDLVLQQTAHRLSAVLRRTDTAARIGGDEFVVLLDGLGSADEAEVAAGRVRDAITVPMDVDGHEVTVGVSIGIAAAESTDVHAEDLLRRADAAMYDVKASRRGGTAVTPEQEAG